MTNSQRLATVRAHLARWLSENVAAEEASAAKIVSESILIRDGFYGGRTFHAVAGDQPFRATWFMEPDELKIRDGQGEVVAVFQGDQIEAAPEQSPASGDEDDRPVSLPMPQVAAAESDRENDEGDEALPQAA